MSIRASRPPSTCPSRRSGLSYLVGATLWIAPKAIASDPEALPKALIEQRISVLHAVPTLLALFDRDVPGLRLINLGGEMCPASLVERWAAAGRQIFNTYGPTEATVSASMAELHAGDAVTIGLPLPNYGATGDRARCRAGPQTAAARRGRRTVYCRPRRRVGLPRPARTDGREIPCQPLVGRHARRPALPHRRSGAHRRRRARPVPRPHRRSGQDPRLPGRTRRDRSRAGAAAGRRHRGRGAATGRGYRPVDCLYRGRKCRRRFGVFIALGARRAAAALHGARPLRGAAANAAPDFRQDRSQDAQGHGRWPRRRACPKGRTHQRTRPKALCSQPWPGSFPVSRSGALRTSSTNSAAIRCWRRGSRQFFAPTRALPRSRCATSISDAPWAELRLPWRRAAPGKRRLCPTGHHPRRGAVGAAGSRRPQRSRHWWPSA